MTTTRTFGDYTIIKQLGQGSLGTVYLAEHRFMKAHYLLKVLPEELSSDRNFIARLEEDVGAIALLDHPGLVKIHNVSYANGHYFLVIDCIVDEVGETTNLAQHLIAKGATLREEEIYGMLKQIAEALDYAHAKKMIHRSIKLSNILVGKGGSLHLADFGLTRIIGTGAVLTRIYKNVAETIGAGCAVVSSKTESPTYPSPEIDNSKLVPLHASFLQNFAFLAPEQRRLDASAPVTIKADVYAFGVLAYYLLMGVFPEGIFDSPSVKPRQYNWDPLVADCLQFDPQRRPEFLIPALEAVKQPKKARSADDTGSSTNSTAEEMIEKTAPVARVEEAPVVAKEKESPVFVQPKAEQPILADPKTGELKPVIKTAELERPVTDPDPARVFQVDNTVKTYTPERKEIQDIEPIHTDMVIIPGGSFTRGSTDGNRDEMPRHRVSVTSFAIDIHPVTNEQFVRFLEVMGGEKDSNHLDIIRLKDSRIKRSAGKVLIESGYAKHPVVGVTWYGATAYAKWVGKRLPTEAEWEIAAQAGVDQALYPTGDDCEKTQANYFSSDTIAVMSYPPNGYGLYDMAGNVYEWCQDWYGYNYYEVSVQEPDDPKGPLQGVYRVLRGGCWKSLKEDLRCSRRHRNNPGTVNSTYGFRCAADVQAQEKE